MRSSRSRSPLLGAAVLIAIVVVLVGFIAILANIFTRGMWFGGGRKNNNREGGGQIGAILMIVGVVFVVHIALAMELILLLPFTKLAHIVYRPIAIWFTEFRRLRATSA